MDKTTLKLESIGSLIAGNWELLNEGKLGLYLDPPLSDYPDAIVLEKIDVILDFPFESIEDRKRLVGPEEGFAPTAVNEP